MTEKKILKKTDMSSTFLYKKKYTPKETGRKNPHWKEEGERRKGSAYKEKSY